MSHKITLELDLSSYWHIGSGKGADAVADAVVLKDEAGLPVVPGRTLKGLLRDCMELASLSGKVSPERIVRWFGTPIAGRADDGLQFDSRTPDGGSRSDGDGFEMRLEEGRFASSAGSLWFGSATLGKAWTAWARTAARDTLEPIVSNLFAFMASTAIEADGTAKDHTLRVKEATVPMKLVAEIHGPADDTQWVADLQASLPLLRALGSRRTRGYGRVSVKIVEGAAR